MHIEKLEHSKFRRNHFNARKTQIEIVRFGRTIARPVGLIIERPIWQTAIQKAFEPLGPIARQSTIFARPFAPKQLGPIARQSTVFARPCAPKQTETPGCQT